jgi:hypothetical protein
VALNILAIYAPIASERSGKTRRNRTEIDAAMA